VTVLQPTVELLQSYVHAKQTTNVTLLHTFSDRLRILKSPHMFRNKHFHHLFHQISSQW